MSANLSYDDKAWSLLYKSILDGLGADATNFQLLYPFTSWNWPETNVGFTTAAQYDFCATMPQWSATGGYVSGGTRFNDAYQNFLSVIMANTTDPQLQQEILNQQNKVQQAKNDYDIVYKQALMAYEDATGGTNVPVFDEWLGTRAGQSWRQQLDDKWAVYQQESQNLNSLVDQSETPGLKNALEKYNDQSFYTKYQDSNLSSFPSVPAWSISQSATAWRQQVEGGGGTGGSISFANSDSAYDYKNTWAGGSASVGNWFWSVAVGGSWQRITEFESDQSLKSSLTFKAWDQVGITAGGWYDGGFVSFHKNGPFIKGFSGYKENGGTYMWGEGGAFNLLKTGMYVAYQPNFSITVSQSTFDSFYQKWEASTGIRIGPFSFGGKTGQTEQKWTKSSSGLTFEGKSESNIPLIFGVTLEELNEQP